MKVEFLLQPKQEELRRLLEVPGVVNIGYGGPRGGGKSRGIRDCMLIRRFAYPNSTGWLLRRTYEDVYDNHIKKYFDERPYAREWYNASLKTMTLPGCGSKIIFRYAEHEGDLQRSAYGKEAQDIFLDQGEQFSEQEINFLRTCRRAPGIADGLCKMVSTINPGGLSHEYHKRVYIDRLYCDNEIPGQYAFISASGWDNVEWVRTALAEDGVDPGEYVHWEEGTRFEYFVTRSQYGRDLNALPESMRIQQLLGKWDYFEGQVFPELGRVHDLDTYFDTADPVKWNAFHQGFSIIGALDHASTGITAYPLTGVDVDENLFVLDLYYKGNCLISEHAEAIKQMRSRYRTPVYQLIDPSTEAKTLQNRDEMFSVQDAYRRQGLTFISAHRSSIAVGLDLMKEYLKIDPLHRNPFTQELGSPRLFISRRRCPDLWREMTGLRRVEGEFVGADHAVDGVRYVIMSRPRAPQRKEKDVSRLPTQDQLMVRSHAKWAKAFDRVKQGGETWW